MTGVHLIQSYCEVSGLHLIKRGIPTLSLHTKLKLRLAVAFSILLCTFPKVKPSVKVVIEADRTVVPTKLQVQKQIKPEFLKRRRTPMLIKKILGKIYSLLVISQ